MRRQRLAARFRSAKFVASVIMASGTIRQMKIEGERNEAIADSRLRFKAAG
jgi:hypothetical protein